MPPTASPISGRPDPTPRRGARDALDFSAFCLLHRARWAQYAGLRVGDRARGERAVQSAFAELATNWGDILRGPNPTARAWRILGRAVSRYHAAVPDSLHDTLPPPQADAVVLHYRLGMTLTATADLMGTDPPEVAAHLVLAERALPTDVVRALERGPDGS